MACDCCGNMSSWMQKVGGEIINLCEEHHTILRTKVPTDIDIETDKDVLAWLKKQPPNHHKVVKYGIFIIGRRTLTGKEDMEKRQ